LLLQQEYLNAEVVGLVWWCGLVWFGLVWFGLVWFGFGRKVAKEKEK